MNRLLKKQDADLMISKAELLADVDCLFAILKEAYGLYEHYGDARFQAAKAQIVRNIESDDFVMADAAAVMMSAFAAFLGDGHFRIGPAGGEPAAADFAVRYTDLHGIPMIVCRKFWYDSPAEREQLERFAGSGPDYRDAETLIIDVRDNPGGSDVYIWDFIKGLYGAEPDYPCRYIQKHSPLYREYAAAGGWDLSGRPDVEQTECDGVRIPSRRQIYVLINEGTASSGESAIAYLKTIENTVVVGTRSAGCFTCGNCMTAYLPHSHLPVYFGTGMVLYEKHRNMDDEGGFGSDISYDTFMDRIADIDK